MSIKSNRETGKLSDFLRGAEKAMEMASDEEGTDEEALQFVVLAQTFAMMDLAQTARALAGKMGAALDYAVMEEAPPEPEREYTVEQTGESEWAVIRHSGRGSLAVAYCMEKADADLLLSALLRMPEREGEKVDPEEEIEKAFHEAYEKSVTVTPVNSVSLAALRLEVEKRIAEKTAEKTYHDDDEYRRQGEVEGLEWVRDELLAGRK